MFNYFPVTVEDGLGNVYQIRGDLDKAEEMCRKSLAIEERLGRLEGMAADYGNLGDIYKTRGDLGRAEEMYRTSLEIFQRLGSSRAEQIKQSLVKLRGEK